MDQRELSLVQCHIHNAGGSAGQGKCVSVQRGSDCCSPLKELLSMAGFMLCYVTLTLTVYFFLVLGCYGIKHGLNLTQKYDFSIHCRFLSLSQNKDLSSTTFSLLD